MIVFLLTTTLDLLTTTFLLFLGGVWGGFGEVLGVVLGGVLGGVWGGVGKVFVGI